MKKLLALLFVTLAVSMAWAQETWMGFYLQGNKVGYIHYQTQPDPENKDLTLRTSNFVFDASMLGQPLKINVQSWSWVDNQNRLVKTRQKTDSGGRINDVTALYTPTEITATMVTSGDTTTQKIPVPAGAKILDDPVTEFVTSGLAIAGQSTEVYVFAPESLTLQKVNLVVKGNVKVESQGQTVDAVHILVDDPRAATELFISTKGDLIKATGPMGMEYRPEPKEVAMAFGTAQGDLALASTVPVIGKVDLEAPTARYKVTGANLARVPQDPSQATKPLEGGTLLWVKPLKPSGPGVTIAEAARQQPDWVNPDIRIPSDSPRFQELARSLVGNEQNVLPAAQKLKDHVFEIMRADAGIGVMRDANEILDTRVGVCRDYAVLLGTLTRAAGIPTRFISGLVYTGNEFLYHAWVEVWDGKNWIGLDSTRPEPFVTTGHIKTAQGTVGDGLVGFLLDGAKMEVLKEEKD